LISLELGHHIAKVYLIGYCIVFVLSYLNKDNNKSNLIITSLALFGCIFNQYLKENLSFYIFYLGAALQLLALIFISVFTHLFFKIKHEQTSIFIYFLYVLMAISYMVLHRVRVVMYDTDEPILWLINSQSIFTLTLYFLSICVFAYGCKIRWKWQFGRLF
jgi:hypothetical protein